MPMNNTNEYKNLAVYSVLPKRRNLTSPIKLAGRTVCHYKSVDVIEYVDLKTGEIFKAKDLGIAGIEVGAKTLQAEYVLNSLRKEVRDFAYFVLRFRNKRRGITPGINQLIKWYADLNQKQTSHVKRYVAPLKETGVLAGENLLGRFFQYNSKSATYAEHAIEDGASIVALLMMHIQKEPFKEINLKERIDQLLLRIRTQNFSVSKIQLSNEDAVNLAYETACAYDEFSEEEIVLA